MKNPHGQLLVGNDLYVAAWGSGAVAHFRVDPASGDLAFQASLGTGDPNFSAAELVAAPDGRFLYVSAWGGQSIVRMSRDATTGSLSAATTTTAGPGAGVALSRDSQGDFLYVADWMGDRILVYSRDETTGELAATGSVQEGVAGVSGLDGVESLAISGDNKHLYAAAREDSTLVTFTRDAASGELTLQSVKRDGAAGVDGLNHAANVVVSPDDEFVYVAAPHDNGVGVFDRDPGTGEPSFLQLYTDQIFVPGPTGGTVPGGGLNFTGSEGISINGGDEYTNDVDVRLVVRAPGNATALRLSNDGGFADPGLRSLPATTVRWRLDSSGSERLPKTVYARFAGPSGVSSISFTDDIILDQTEPRVIEAAIVSAGGQGAASGVRAAARRRPVAYRLALKARDNASGVARVQVTQNRRRPGRATRFRRRVTFNGQRGRTILVRVIDRAGNRSAWRRVRR
jgi:6-phosphogluconolactonase (cycloisomerase 2 family)